jgi:hypothetical protein
MLLVMPGSNFILRHPCFSMLVLAMHCVPEAVAGASQSAPSDPSPAAWQFNASLYVFLPTVDTTTAFPADSNGSAVNLSSAQILDHLEFFFMGTMAVSKGRWGLFTDVAYLDIAASKTQSRDFTFGTSGVPGGTTADLSYTLKGLAWTVAGQYRVPTHDALKLDILTGVRLFEIDQTLTWNLMGDLGVLTAAGRLGSSEVRDTLWDAVIGIQGDYLLGSSKRFSIPFYLDIGAGDAALTLQASTGVRYAFGAVSVNAVWRYLGYELPPGSSTSKFNFTGPQVGVTIVW